jgi:hypothetical protein
MASTAGTVIRARSQPVATAPATLLLAALLVMAAPSAARADDFRIHTKVFAAGAKEPASENTTIFCGGLVYDFIEKPAEALVFDPGNERFALINPQREQWAEITVGQIDALVPALKQKLAARDDALSAFLVDPRFKQAAGAAAGEIEFVASWMRYQVQAAPAANDEFARQYAVFSFHSTRLNALRRPPLLARLAVNEWLAERKLIPQFVKLTSFSKNRAGEMVREAEFRSEHAIARELTGDDLGRLEKVPRWQADFRRVNLTTYWGLSEDGQQ